MIRKGGGDGDVGRRAYLQPLLLLFGQHPILHHLRLNGHTCESFKTQPDVSVEVILRLFERAMVVSTIITPYEENEHTRTR